jgi:hypothetical protein
MHLKDRYIKNFQYIRFRKYLKNAYFKSYISLNAFFIANLKR